MTMRWYWYRAGGHTHVRVFMRGAKCGDLCFRNEEFDAILAPLSLANEGQTVEFVQEPPPLEREREMRLAQDALRDLAGQKEPDGDMGRMEHDDRGDN